MGFKLTSGNTTPFKQMGSSSLRSGNTTPIKHMGSSPVKQTQHPVDDKTSYSDSLDIYKRQTELNTIADQLNKHIRDNTAVLESKKFGNQRTYNFPWKFDYSQSKKATDEGLRLKREWNKKHYQFYSTYANLKDKNPANIDQSLGDPSFVGSDADIGKGQTWGLNKYKPVFPTKPKEVKSKPKVELTKMPIIQPELIKTSFPEPVLKGVDVPEYTAPTIDEDLSKEFRHRKYKEESGKHFMFNPALGKWKPITKKSYKLGIKNSTYNKETNVYEQWWHKGRSKKDSVTDESILEYLELNAKKNKYGI